MSEPAEGWYADPSGANQLRWWDGHAWTDYVEPYEAPVAPIPMPGSPVDEKDSDEADAPEKSGTLKWVLACAASWVLVAVFITVLVIAWSHLGASGRIQEDAKSRAETAQNELDTARSTLESINQQLQEATK